MYINSFDNQRNENKITFFVALLSNKTHITQQSM